MNNIVLPSWRPKKRNVRYQECPEGVPDWVYTEAVAAKRFYNEDWEFWVWQTAQEHNCSMAEAEDACIRGLQRTLNCIIVVYGDKIGRWFEDYLDMGDIFRKVKHPEYIPELGYRLAEGLRR
jgi:hypothetical protein